MTDDQTLVVRLRKDQQAVIERLRAAYDAKAEQRQPALDLADEAQRIAGIGSYHELTLFVAQLAIGVATGESCSPNKAGLSPEELAKVQAVERVFYPHVPISSPLPSLDVTDSHAVYNPLAILFLPDFDNPGQYNQNIRQLFSSPNTIAGYYNIAAACLRDLQRTTQQRDRFSDICSYACAPESIGGQFHTQAAQGMELLRGYVTLEITDPFGPDYLVKERINSMSIRRRHPFQGYITDLAQRVQEAKGKAVAVFDKKFLDGFLLEDK